MAKDNRNTWQKQKEQNQKRFYWVLSLLLVAAIIVVIAVPVSYVPLFSNISQKFGLSNEIARKLTLVDLAFSSLGVETKNMKETFKKADIVYEPSVFLASRYETQDKRLLDARQMYYNEYEYTHKRPAEIAGIYQDGKEAETPELAAQAVGVRAVPEEDYLSDNFSNTKISKISGNSDISVADAGTIARKARQASDRDEAKRAAEQKINESLPQFANSIYDKKPTDAELSKDKNEQAMTETLDLNNSRIIKPILQGSVTSIGKKTSPIESLMSAGTVSHVLGTPGTFGGHEALGYYVGDDLPKAQGRLLDYYYFGSTGMDVFNSYYYSYAATSRRYKESAKYLAEITFNGADAKNEILVAPGQSEDTVTRVANEDSPLDIVAAVKSNDAKCTAGRNEYKEKTKQLKRNYNAAKDILLDWSLNHSASYQGAPGCCKTEIHIFNNILLGEATSNFRRDWNNKVDEIYNYCTELKQYEADYAGACKMSYGQHEGSDSCGAILALKVDGGCSNFDMNPACKNHIKWTPDYSSINKFKDHCDGKPDCHDKINELFKDIDTSIQLQLVGDYFSED